jgi:hypothetical protein
MLQWVARAVWVLQLSSGPALTPHTRTQPPPPAGTYNDISASRRTDASQAAPPLMGRSLWLLAEDHPVRVWLYDLVTSRYFDYFMFALILLNCVTMAYEHPGMDKGALDATILHWRWLGVWGGGWQGSMPRVL